MHDKPKAAVVPAKPKTAAAEPAKPTAPVIPRKRVPITAPPKKSSAAATAVVAPMASAANSTAALEKPKRARITAPEADKPLSKVGASALSSALLAGHKFRR